MPERVLQRKTEDRKWPVDTCVIEIAPIRLEEKMNRINVPDVFVGRYDENVVEDKCV